MEKWHALLDALNERTGLSDRKLGTIFGLGEGAVTAWRTGRGFPDDKKAEKMAELLQLDPAYVITIIQAARAKGTTRETWQRIARAFNKAAAVVAFIVAPFMSPQDSRAAFDTNAYCAALPCDGERPSNARQEYTLRRNRRRWWQRLAAWLGASS